LLHFFRWVHHPLPWINNWLTDIVFIPATAHLALTITRCYLVKDGNYRYPLRHLLFIAVYTTLLCEWLLPAYIPGSVCDPWDGVAYLAGALFFYYIHQRC
jgi:hypothetical protein